MPEVSEGYLMNTLWLGCGCFRQCIYHRLFSGTVDFDPGPGTANLTTPGDNDIFVAKYDASGNYVFAFQVGGSQGDWGRSITLDGSANIYITGAYSGTADFDPGPGTVTLTGDSGLTKNLFIAKYNSSGGSVYEKSMYGTTSADEVEGNSIAVDGLGKVYVTGDFSGTVDFDPDTGTVNLTSSDNDDIFLAKYDSNGNYVFTHKIGDSGNESASSIKLDGSANIYLTGGFMLTVDFGPGSATTNLISAGSGDVFFAKYTSSGAFQFAKSIRGTYNEIGVAIGLDTYGNIYLTGTFKATADFDPDAGTQNLSSSVYVNSFVGKYNSSGNYLWVIQLGNNQVESYFADQGNSIAVDNSGNVYVTGTFAGIADFDPGPGIANLVSQGSGDIFVAKYDASGNYIWAFGIGGIYNDYAQFITIDNSGKIYITGAFMSTVDFDPESGITNLTSNGSYDIFIARYSNSGTLGYARSLGGNQADVGNVVKVDTNGFAYLTGYFTGTANFSTNATPYNLTSAGHADIFFAKFNTLGERVFATRLGGIGYDNGISLALDGSSNIFLTGLFNETVDFDPGTQVVHLVSAGLNDAFVAKYTSSGDFQYAFSIGGTGVQTAMSITADASGNAYVTGYFQNTVDFDPSPGGTANLTSTGSSFDRNLHHRVLYRHNRL